MYVLKILLASIGLWLLPSFVNAEEWPVDPGPELLWYWGHLDQPGMIEDADGEWVRDCDVRLRGRTRPNWFLGAHIQHGSLQAMDMGPVMAAAYFASDPLYIEMALHPASDGSDKGILFNLGPEDGIAGLKIFIENGHLKLQQQENDSISLGRVDLSVPRHITVLLAHEQVQWWLDGNRQNDVDGDFRPDQDQDIADWELTFGGTISGDQAWPGVFEAILLAQEPRNPETSAAAWRARHQARSAPAVSEVEAVLVAHSEEPSASDLMDYDECILASVWRIEQQISGPAIEAEQVVTWHWYQLDRQVLDQARPLAMGTRRTLRLSAAEDNPQISSIQRVDTGLDPVQLLELNEYLLIDGHLAED